MTLAQSQTGTEPAHATRGGGRPDRLAEAVAIRPPIELQPWVAIVANPYSGSGSNRMVVGKLEAALKRRGLTPRVLWDPLERAAVLRDPQWAESCRCVVAAGGDGTVADAINETRDIPLAILPMGNENLLARHFGFSGADQVAEAVLRGRTRRIDLGRINNRYFAIMVSAGLDADVVERVARWRVAEAGLRRVTRLSYVRPFFGAMFGYKYPPLELTVDGQTFKGSHVLVFNIAEYACGLKFAPDCRDDDGLLHYVILGKPGIVALGGYLMSLVLGRHRRCQTVRTGRAKTLKLNCASPSAVQVDGDPSGRTPVTIEAVPQALQVMLPPSHD